MPYARKYKTTAKGRAARKPPSARYTKPHKKKMRYAPRYSGVRAPRRQGIKRRIVSALNDIAETQLISTKIVQVRPSPLQFNLINGVVHYNLGSTVMSNVNSGMVAGGHLDQFNMGTTGTGLVGKAAYIKRNTHIFQIRMTSIEDATFNADALGPIHFRVLILANRARMNTINSTPETSCFINHAGNTFGYDSNGVVDSLAIKSALVNKKNFVVLRDQQFVLGAPTYALYKTLPGNPDDFAYSAAGGNSYPAVKMFKHITQVNKKCLYDSTGVASSPPLNYADDLYVCIIAHSQSGQVATNWEVDLTSTTTYTDM